jgi:tetratricopeptide (TPR) repeat protein
MKSSDHALCRGLALYQQSEFSGADETARAALVEFPDDGPLWQLHGMARSQMGDWAAALAALETASLLIPLDPVAECNLADCYYKAGKTDLARQMYRHLATSGRYPAESLLMLAARLGNVGDNAQALKLCREKWRRTPTAHEALFGMAYYMRRLGRPIRAIIPVVKRAQAIAPKNTTYRVLLASLLTHIGQIDEAYELLLRDVSPATVDCCCCLHRMLTIFRIAGDEARTREVQAQIEQRRRPKE